MLTKDAKQRSGQGLSRLLNVADGLVGQGLRVVLLLTTNEEMQELHEAVSRPGRCASQVLFRPFHRDEGRAWLAARGKDAIDLAARTTLAELYAESRGQTRARITRVVGFQGAA